jgi:hypothetical protein
MYATLKSVVKILSINGCQTVALHSSNKVSVSLYAVRTKEVAILVHFCYKLQSFLLFKREGLLKIFKHI